MKRIISIVVLMLLAGSAAFAQTGEKFIAGSPAWEVLAPERKTLTERFQNYSPEPRFQTVRHASGASTILVYFPGSGPHPALFGIAPDKTITWRNYDPVPGAAHIYKPRLAADDQGNVILIWEDTQPSGIHAQQFDSKGQAVWTQQVASVPWAEKVDDRDYISWLNAIFWPKQGWVVAYSTFKRAVVHLLDAKGQQRWPDGVKLAEKQNDHNPISLIQDSPDSILALWYEHGFLQKPPGKSQFKAQRISPEGKFLWQAPIVVGEAPAFAMTKPREIKLTLLPDAKVRADLYRGMAGDAVRRITEYQAVIAPDGQVKTNEDALPEKPQGR